MEKIKSRSLNELRQEKEFGYKTPLSHINQNKKNNNEIVSIITNLCRENGNDYDFGQKVRTLLINNGLYK